MPPAMLLRLLAMLLLPLVTQPRLLVKPLPVLLPAWATLPRLLLMPLQPQPLLLPHLPSKFLLFLLFWGPAHKAGA